MSNVGRFTFVLLLIVASSLVAYFLFVLWTTVTPGWWFSLIFTVMLGGLGIAGWAVFIAASRSGKDRARARLSWDRSAGTVQAIDGTVIARDVRTREDGSVTRFELTVRCSNERELRGCWRPQAADARNLLQTQVPGIGTSARVWHSPGAAADHPFVIEVLDPSVVPGSGGSVVPKYVD